MIDYILEWLAGWILSYLLSKTTQVIVTKTEEIRKDQERGEINDANVKAYEEATLRQDRIRAATDLLNGVSRP